MCSLTYDAVPPRRSFQIATDSIRTRLAFPSRVQRKGICQLLTCTLWDKLSLSFCLTL